MALLRFICQHKKFPKGNVPLIFTSVWYKIPVREHDDDIMIQSTRDIGQIIREVRKRHAITQSDLALTAGTGLRFIVELEKGKPTCQIGKVLQVLEVLGIQCNLSKQEIESDEQ